MMDDPKEPRWNLITPPIKRTTLVVGLLTAEFEEGDLRHIRFGTKEIVRRVYGAVRDQQWATIPGIISGLSIKSTLGEFQIRYTCTHHEGDVHFVWQAEIDGHADGTITFSFSGEAKSTFLRNRIGLCVLHPETCAGTQCKVERVDGSRADLEFPTFIEPAQPVPGIDSLKCLSSVITPGTWLKTSFEGDLFEMEDQRNWTDASFKTYSTPQSLPYPVEVRTGTCIYQKVRFEIVNTEADTARPGIVSIPASLRDPRLLRLRHGTDEPFFIDDPVQISLGTERTPLPRVGLCAASHGLPLAPKEIELISNLWLWHLRVDIRLADPAWPNALRYGHYQAMDLGLPLELAVHLPSIGGDNELEQLARGLRGHKSDVARVLVFLDGSRTVSSQAYTLARKYLGFLEAPIGAGTDLDFFHLNQVRPPFAEADFIHWSMNPQIHAFDIRSIAETPATVAAQLTSAHAYFGGKPVAVSPVSLKPRSNPLAADVSRITASNELPSDVDARQMTPFAAGWTLAMLKYLGEGGAEDITLFETTGWLGVMEQLRGSSLPQLFPSQPGQVFPLYYPIAELTSFNRGEVIRSHSSEPLRIESLALTKKGFVCLYLANLTGEMQTANVTGFKTVTHRREFDWESDALFMFRPELFIRKPGPEVIPPPGKTHEVLIGPYGIVRLDLELPGS